MLSTIMESELQTWAESWVKGGSLPGMLLGVWHENEEVAFVNSSGLSSYTRDSLFRIYSMTKPITTAGFMILVERGLVSINDPVSKYLPAFGKIPVYIEGGTGGTKVRTEPQHARGMLVKDLMNHSSGLSYGIFGASAGDAAIKNAVGQEAGKYSSCSSCSPMRKQTHMLHDT